MYVTPDAFKETKQLPGYVRHRVMRAIGALSEDPRPSRSQTLRQSELPLELRRVRLARWRIVYVISEFDAIVDVIAVRRRPPYDYGDLPHLLRHLR